MSVLLGERSYDHFQLYTGSIYLSNGIMVHDYEINIKEIKCTVCCHFYFFLVRICFFLCIEYFPESLQETINSSCLPARGTVMEKDILFSVHLLYLKFKTGRITMPAAAGFLLAPIHPEVS